MYISLTPFPGADLYLSFSMFHLFCFEALEVVPRVSYDFFLAPKCSLMKTVDEKSDVLDSAPSLLDFCAAVCFNL